MKNSQGGFTLVEIAIVLVIIGLLLGGVLKGQELITQAKIKNVANDLNGMSAAVYGYQDRFKKFPGDDNDAGTRWLNPQTFPGDGNGAVGAANPATVIACPVASAAGIPENCLFWQHLRLAGFVGGDASSPLAPQNAGGGVIQAQNGALNLAGLTICSTNLLGRIASAIDSQFDDGRPGTGQVRGAVFVAGANWAPLAATDAYVDDGSTVYVICKSL